MTPHRPRHCKGLRSGNNVAMLKVSPQIGRELIAKSSLAKGLRHALERAHRIRIPMIACFRTVTLILPALVAACPHFGVKPDLSASPNVRSPSAM